MCYCTYMTESTSPAEGDQTGLLGANTRTSYQRRVDVIAAIEQSMSGNTVLRVGVFEQHAMTWQSGGAAHIVLTPAERDALIAELIRQRHLDPRKQEPLCEGDANHGLCALPAGHYDRVGTAHIPAPWRVAR